METKRSLAKWIIEKKYFIALFILVALFFIKKSKPTQENNYNRPITTYSLQKENDRHDLYDQSRSRNMRAEFRSRQNYEDREEERRIQKERRIRSQLKERRIQKERRIRRQLNKRYSMYPEKRYTDPIRRQFVDPYVYESQYKNYGNQYEPEYQYRDPLRKVNTY